MKRKQTHICIKSLKWSKRQIHNDLHNRNTHFSYSDSFPFNIVIFLFKWNVIVRVLCKRTSFRDCTSILYTYTYIYVFNSQHQWWYPIRYVFVSAGYFCMNFSGCICIYISCSSFFCCFVFDIFFVHHLLYIHGFFLSRGYVNNKCFAMACILALS